MNRPSGTRTAATGEEADRDPEVDPIAGADDGAGASAPDGASVGERDRRQCAPGVVTMANTMPPAPGPRTLVAAVSMHQVGVVDKVQEW